MPTIPVRCSGSSAGWIPRRGSISCSRPRRRCWRAAIGSSSRAAAMRYLADPFRELAAANPRQVAFIERFDRAMARRIYAGADAFVMPSRFEPCGQGQMIALRYGTPPDRPSDGRSRRHRRGRGRARPGPARASSSMTRPRRACSTRAPRSVRCGRPAARAWEGLLDRGMAVDFDWTSGSAPTYVEAYRRAIEIKRR